VQLLHKEPTTSSTANVGWHQDEHYWRTWWAGEAFTIWLDMSEVTLDSGPVCFVEGSHRWGYIEGGDLYNKDLTSLQAGLALPSEAEWREVSIPLHPGEATMHSRMTLHGSRPNVEAWPRRGFAIHLVTERATIVEPYPPYTDVHDLVECPIIWDHGPVT
jgi:ectoine hydroxylase-related dioxygenase (phytanoyl-CoA dioxygenase family)